MPINATLVKRLRLTQSLLLIIDCCFIGWQPHCT